MTSAASPRVSIVVPAYNAEATLRQTLDSVIAQTFGAWETIVVDDGSSDASGEIANQYAAMDDRIRVVHESQRGEGGARNAGIAQAAGEWLLFLDADDWIAPAAVESFLAAEQPQLDAIVGGWIRVTVDGSTIRDPFRLDTTDLFPTLAHHCPFAIHACLVRRSVVVALGGFEEGMAVGADWDLWQRVARTGARFGTIDAVVAFYRVRPQSAVANIPALVASGIRLITLGHGADPRVQHPHHRYRYGLPKKELDAALLRFICWPAGMCIGTDQDAAGIIAAIGEVRDLEMEPSAIAHSIYLSALLPRSYSPSMWPSLWGAAEPRIDAFLTALERQSGTRDLARRVKQALERLVVAQAGEKNACRIGTVFQRPVEVTAPIDNVTVDPGVELVLAQIFLDGTLLGMVGLPVCDEMVAGAVLADAIAEYFSWSILGGFFARHVYPSFDIRPTTEGAAGLFDVWRGDLEVGHALPERVARNADALHDIVGWTVLLQELWDEPSRPSEWFYDERADDSRDADGAQQSVIDVAMPLRGWRTGRPLEHLELRVGGTPVARVDMSPMDGVITPSMMRARGTIATGYELCRVAVRDAILGCPLDDPTALHVRLAKLAATAPRESSMLPAWVATLGASSNAVVYPRRHGPVGTSVSRRAMFPRVVADAVHASAVAAGEAVPSSPVGGDAAVGPIIYAPELFDETSFRSDVSVAKQSHNANTTPTAGFDRHYFETVFAESRDPWSYATLFEQRKYDQTMSLVETSGRTERILEIACAEGMLTERLARVASHVLATDIAQIAIDRTSARCAVLPNVQVQRLDVTADPVPTGYDVIVCSEVLYYVGGRDAVAEIAKKLADALAIGGRIVMTHSNVVVDDPTSPGLDWDVPIGAKGIGEVFAATPSLRFSREIRTPLYRVQLFERVEEQSGRELPAVEDGEWIEPAPHVAARFLMHGGMPRKGGIPDASTHALPILTYHSVAPSNNPAFARYRITPEQFEEQLEYLRDTRFRSVTLDEWRLAKQAWTPLRGRAVLLTFDDGFEDFAKYAWPLLRRYGFGATVFLVSGHVGGTNAWDAAYGEQTPLMGWDTIRRLRAEGVDFGSHTVSHPFLTARPPAEVAREFAESRAELAEGLGEAPVAVAYPHGAENISVQHLAGATGYWYGLSNRPGRSALSDPLLALSRIEVRGDAELHDFITKLG